MHLKRWLTGIIAVPILILVIGPAPRWMFCALLYVASLAGLVEFYRITSSTLPKSVQWFNYVLTFFLFYITSKGEFYHIPSIIALWAFVPMTLFTLNRHAPNQQLTGDFGKALLGPVWVCLPLVMLMIIDRRQNGNLWIFFLLTVIFAGDTGAFYFGKIFGRHKLLEAVSPGKTWEGAIGALLTSLVAALLFMYVLTFHQFNVGIVILVLFLSVSAQLGDLAESMLKRNHGAKDSGNILPGHGGILDRIDGLLFSIPVLYAYLSFCIV